jgi:hypothetical protein
MEISEQHYSKLNAQLAPTPGVRGEVVAPAPRATPLRVGDPLTLNQTEILRVRQRVEELRAQVKAEAALIPLEAGTVLLGCADSPGAFPKPRYEHAWPVGSEVHPYPFPYQLRRNLAALEATLTELESA